MKDFIIYTQPRKAERKLEEREYSLDELQKVPGTSSFQELELVKNGTLIKTNELEPYRTFKFSCEILVQLVSATKPVFAPLSFELWQQKHGRLVITFAARKKASRVAVSLLSLVLYGDPFAITPVRLTASDFRNLKEYIIQKYSGNLTHILLHDIRSEAGTVNRLLMSGASLEKFLNFDQLLENASKIRGMGFAITPFYGGRRFSFRIKDWGGGQIYSPAVPLDHEITGLLKLFEEALFSNI